MKQGGGAENDALQFCSVGEAAACLNVLLVWESTHFTSYLSLVTNSLAPRKEFTSDRLLLLFWIILGERVLRLVEVNLGARRYSFRFVRYKKMDVFKKRGPRELGKSSKVR